MFKMKIKIFKKFSAPFLLKKSPRSFLLAVLVISIITLLIAFLLSGCFAGVKIISRTLQKTLFNQQNLNNENENENENKDTDISSKEKGTDESKNGKDDKSKTSQKSNISDSKFKDLFDESKALNKSTAYFYDEDSGLVFPYPAADVILSSVKWMQMIGKNVLVSVTKTDIKELKNDSISPEGYTKEMAYNEKSEIEQGSFGQNNNFSFEPSQRIMKLNVFDLIII